MEKSKVYFTDPRIKSGLNLLKKLNNLIIKSGIKQIDFEKKMTADKAPAGMVASSPGLRGSKILEKPADSDLSGMDKFRMTHPDTCWQSGIEHAVKIGPGKADYEPILI